MATKRAELMDELYGVNESIRVYELLKTLDPKLNEIVQRIAYDYFWALEGLSIRDKSLVTVASLIALRKEQQIRPHLIGFLNTGGTIKEVLGILLHFSKLLGLDSAQKGFDIFCDILKEKNEDLKVISELQDYFDKAIKNSIDDSNEISKRDAQLINVAACVAIGNQEKTVFSIRKYLDEAECSESDLRKILLHQIVYCGFPTAINGFGALKTVLDEKRK